MEASKTVGEALEFQRAISYELMQSSLMSEKLYNILQKLAKTVKVDAVLLYATVNDNYLEIVSEYKAQNYKTNIRFNEGFIGRSAADKRYEMNFELELPTLSIPILRLNNTIGVVVLEHHRKRNFDEEEIELAETLVLCLSDLLARTDFVLYRNQIIHEKGIAVRNVMHGTGLCKGFGVGRAVIHHRRRENFQIFAENIEIEKSKLEDGKQKLLHYLDEKITQAENYIGSSTEIMEAYKMFVMDKGWYKRIIADIEKGYTAEAAVEHVYEDMWKRLSLSQDDYLKERLYDLRDVSDKLQMFITLDTEEVEKNTDEDIIIIAQSMGPADLIDYNYERIRGLIIEDCTPTMHVVIVAKALNIPVVSKIHGLLGEVKAGQTIALNGAAGDVYTHPSAEKILEYQQKSVSLQKIFADLEKLKKIPNQTIDGTKINLSLNYGLDLDYDYIKPTNCDGIGLYRTEITFMSAETMPDVANQARQYKKLFDIMGNKKIIFRSLDVGSDKFLPYWGDVKEDNPAIGWRSIRITLDRRSILRQQIRAMLRSAEGKELYVMFPMITTVQEFVEAKETLMLEYEREKQRQEPQAKDVKVGIMVEVPSILFQLDEIMQRVDFVSVGTNDLYQFIYACDRSNPRLLARYDVLSAPFLKLMKMIVDKANQYKVYCSVCGEMASNPIEAMTLIGLGYRNLSVSGASYANVKKMLCSLNNEDIEDYVKSLLKSSETSVRMQLKAYAYDHGIAID